MGLVCSSPTCGCTGPWSERRQSRTNGAGAWQREAAARHIPKWAKEGSCKPALASALHWASSVPLALTGCQKILIDLLRGLFPKDKTPIDSAGAGEAKGRAKSCVKQKLNLGIQWLLSTANTQADSANCWESSSLLASFAAGKCACETKQFKTLGTVKKST